MAKPCGHAGRFCEATSRARASGAKGDGRRSAIGYRLADRRADGAAPFKCPEPPSEQPVGSVRQDLDRDAAVDGRPRAYSTSSSATWTAGEAGTYSVRVWARSVGTDATYDTWIDTATIR